MFLETLEITAILPCFADPSKIRFHAEPIINLNEILPYLNTLIPNAIYNHAGHALTFGKKHRIICIFPHLITGAKADDADDARTVLDWLKDLINHTWEKRSEITPSFERRERLTALSVYKLLPGLNCGKCNWETCMAFALQLAAEQSSIMLCSPLFDAPYYEKRALLLQMLKNAGYEVPSALLSQKSDNEE